MGFGRSNTPFSKFKDSLEIENIDFDEFKIPEIDYSHRNKRCGFFRHLWATYDRSVLLVIMFNYFNNGGYSMILMIIVNMYQDTFNIGPALA